MKRLSASLVVQVYVSTRVKWKYVIAAVITIHFTVVNLRDTENTFLFSQILLGMLIFYYSNKQDYLNSLFDNIDLTDITKLQSAHFV